MNITILNFLSIGIYGTDPVYARGTEIFTYL